MSISSLFIGLWYVVASTYVLGLHVYWFCCNSFKILEISLVWNRDRKRAFRFNRTTLILSSNISPKLFWRADVQKATPGPFNSEFGWTLGSTKRLVILDLCRIRKCSKICRKTLFGFIWNLKPECWSRLLVSIFSDSMSFVSDIGWALSSRFLSY